jgi:hypothetical protein
MAKVERVVTLPRPTLLLAAWLDGEDHCGSFLCHVDRELTQFCRLQSAEQLINQLFVLGCHNLNVKIEGVEDVVPKRASSSNGVIVELNCY